MKSGPSMRTPRARVRALGAAGHGAGHWMSERITSVALVPLGLWAIWAVLRAAPEGYEGAVALLRNPFHVVTAVLFLAVSFQHMHAGLRVILEDYVPRHGQRLAWSLLNTTVCVLAGALAIFSVLKVAFGGGAY